MYTSEWIDAARALEVGIATDVFEEDELLDKTLEKAREIAQWPVNSLRETKRTLRLSHQPAIERALEVDFEAMLRQAGSPENIEAIKAFLEERPPNFRGLKG